MLFGFFGYFFIIPWMTARKLKAAIASGFADEIVTAIWDKSKQRILQDVKGEIRATLNNPKSMQELADYANSMIWALIDSTVEIDGQQIKFIDYFSSQLWNNLKMRLMSEGGNMEKDAQKLEKEVLLSQVPEQFRGAAQELLKIAPFRTIKAALAIQQSLGSMKGLSAGGGQSTSSLMTYGH